MARINPRLRNLQLVDDGCGYGRVLSSVEFMLPFENLAGGTDRTSPRNRLLKRLVATHKGLVGPEADADEIDALNIDVALVPLDGPIPNEAFQLRETVLPEGIDDDDWDGTGQTVIHGWVAFEQAA